MGGGGQDRHLVRTLAGMLAHEAVGHTVEATWSWRFSRGQAHTRSRPTW